MTVDDLEKQLEQAREAHVAAVKAWSLSHARRGPEREACNTMNRAMLEAERRLAAARNEEYAEPIAFPVAWDVGAPLPHLLMNDYRAFLSFYTRVVDPNWDGTYVTVKDPGGATTESLALVEFERCIAAKLGAPNDEVFAGHPLYGKGADSYTAQRVRNSRWLAEIEKIESVHRQYRPETWRTLEHYIFWFHDTTFECIAKSFEVERRACSMTELLAEMARRVTG